MLDTSDLDDVLLIRNVKIDAEGKLDEASLRLAAQLPISHEKLDTIENQIHAYLRDKASRERVRCHSLTNRRALVG